jgi:hypothetical protein
MAHPVYATVTGALFYDDAHEYMPDGSTDAQEGLGIKDSMGVASGDFDNLRAGSQVK